MSELDKLNAGEWFNFGAPKIASRKLRAATLAQEFNTIPENQAAQQKAKAREILGSAGKNLVIHSRFNFDNGKNIHVGDNFLANYNLTVLDVGEVNIGNNVWIGPNTDIYTVNHPLTAAGRRKRLARVEPVTIGNDVWICGKVTITPGVTIGDNVVVAAGAVVTKDVPSNTLVAGVPARVIRQLETEWRLIFLQLGTKFTEYESLAGSYRAIWYHARRLVGDSCGWRSLGRFGKDENRIFDKAAVVPHWSSRYRQSNWLLGVGGRNVWQTEPVLFRSRDPEIERRQQCFWFRFGDH